MPLRPGRAVRRARYYRSEYPHSQQNSLFYALYKQTSQDSCSLYLTLYFERVLFYCTVHARLDQPAIQPASVNTRAGGDLQFRI